MDTPSCVSSDSTFDEVYRAHVGLVWRCLSRAGVPESMLEDATQEVFLVYHRRRHEFRGASSIKTWLIGIARGVASNVRRGQQRFLRRLASLSAESGPDCSDDPEIRARQAEARDLVEGFLESLNEAQREVFELIEIEGLRQREAAAVLEININTVASRLRAARAEFERFVRGLEAKESTAREAAHG